MKNEIQEPCLASDELVECDACDNNAAPPVFLTIDGGTRGIYLCRPCVEKAHRAFLVAGRPVHLIAELGDLTGDGYGLASVLRRAAEVDLSSFRVLSDLAADTFYGTQFALTLEAKRWRYVFADRLYLTATCALEAAPEAWRGLAEIFEPYTRAELRQSLLGGDLAAANVVVGRWCASVGSPPPSYFRVAGR